MSPKYAIAYILTIFYLAGVCGGTSSEVNLSEAVIVHSSNTRHIKAAEFLADEIKRRSGISLRTSTSMPADEGPAIVLGRFDSFPCPYESPRGPSIPDKAEGYAVWADAVQGKKPVVYLVGRDNRAVLFAAGRLIRLLDTKEGAITLPRNIRFSTAPSCSLRGHQIAYRGLNNTTDAWTVEQYEQQIRDLIIFGTNTIELIPALDPKTQHTPHMTIPIWEMCEKLSVMIDEYGLDLWIYKSIFRRELSTAEKESSTLARWKAMLTSLHGLDAMLVPGGDGGDLTPQELMVFLAKVKQILKDVNPNVTLWTSHQTWSKEQNEWFYNYLATESPDFLEGVVYGPYGRTTIRQFRNRTPAKYKLRRYPDITHSTLCQYPLRWDSVFLNTLGREPINPMPVWTTTIYRAFEKYADGFITYSDGSHDDLNKIIWSALGWDSSADVNDILYEYGKVFFGGKVAEKVAAGLAMLEQNWAGPIEQNENIEKTLAHWRTIGRDGGEQLERNWRYEMYLFRAMYDAYLQRKHRYEQQYERQANQALLRAHIDGSQIAIANAKTALARIDTLPPEVQKLRAEIESSGLRLFEDIGMQLSEKAPYCGYGIKRGVVLDWLDFPLNNRRWLEEIRFPAILKKEKESDRLALIHETVFWEKPTPDSIYDDLGKVGRQPHLVRQKPWNEDPGAIESPTVEGYYDDVGRNNRLSHLDVVETRFGTPLIMRYKGLNPAAIYTLRVTYSGRYKPTMTLTADGTYQIHGPLKQPEPIAPVEFSIPQAATADGALELQWHLVSGRGCQLGEVWLIRGNCLNPN